MISRADFINRVAAITPKHLKKLKAQAESGAVDFYEYVARYVHVPTEPWMRREVKNILFMSTYGSSPDKIRKALLGKDEATQDLLTQELQEIVGDAINDGRCDVGQLLITMMLEVDVKEVKIDGGKYMELLREFRDDPYVAVKHLLALYRRHQLSIDEKVEALIEDMNRWNTGKLLAWAKEKRREELLGLTEEGLDEEYTSELEGD